MQHFSVIENVLRCIYDKTVIPIHQAPKRNFPFQASRSILQRHPTSAVNCAQSHPTHPITRRFLSFIECLNGPCEQTRPRHQRQPYP